MRTLRKSQGFTLVELLALSALLALAAMLLAPAFAHTRPNTQVAVCLNHLQQLSAAWRLYADDNSGRLVWNRDGGDVGTPYSQNWIGGWLDSSTVTDNTNTALLVDHAKYPNAAYLGPYVKSASAFKCPADLSTVSIGGQRMPRIRSVSMNNSVGEASRSWSGTGTYQLYRKFDMIGKPTPAALWILLDEREESINDGCFFTNPDAAWNLIDYPAAYHNRGAGFAFADGHAEIHRWMDPRTAPVVRLGQTLPFNVTYPGDVDVTWLQQHATSRP